MSDIVELTEENVMEAIENAIAEYFKKGMIADGLFWSRAVALLLSKYGGGE